MGPAQLSVDSSTDGKNKSAVTNLEDKNLECMTSCQEIIPVVEEKTEALKSPKDVEIDIVDSIHKNDTIPAEVEDPDATECSSSFSGTVSDDEKCYELSEAEVESQYIGDGNLATGYDAYSMFPTRKKRLTNHWRNFIRPLMWRCKWLELRFKAMKSQALKYDTELEVYDQIKHSGFDQSSLEGCGSKSLPFPTRCFRRKSMKRRKRKRIEDTTSIASYMTHHNLFSYLENRRSNQDGTSVADDFGNIAATSDPYADDNDKSGINNGVSFFEFKDGDYSLEQLLWKIEVAHSLVHKLKTKLDMVISKNPSRFSSSENLCLLAHGDGQTSSAPSPTISAGYGDTISPGALYNLSSHPSEYDALDLVMPGSIILSYGEAILVPDIIESTVGLLSAADVTFLQPQVGDLCENIVDNILIDNEAVEGEGHTLTMPNNQATDIKQETERGDEGENTDSFQAPTLEPLHVPKTEPTQETLALKPCLASDIHFPTNKRKRGERKPGSGGWSRKCSDEPDSQ